MPTGASLHHAYTHGSITPRLATDTTYRQAHQQPQPKPLGLDWTKHTPTCTSCSQRSSEINSTGLCPDCRTPTPTPAPDPTPAPETPKEGKQGKPTTRPSAPRTRSTSSTTRRAQDAGPSTTQENPPTVQETRPATAGGPTPDHTPGYLRRLQQQRAATHPDPEPTPAADAILDAQIQYAGDLLRRTATSTNPATRVLRANTIAALGALHLYVELHDPDAATPKNPVEPDGSVLDGHTSEGRTSSTPQPARSSDTPRGPRRDRIQLPTPDIENAYTAGATLRDLADQYGVSTPTIARHLDEHGVTRRKQRVDYTPEFIEAVRSRYVDQAMTQEQVAADLDLTVKIVYTAMARGGIRARESAAARSARGVGRAIKIPHADHPQILDRYQGGESAPSIATSYDASPTSIYAILRHHGITQRHRKKTLTNTTEGAPTA